MRLASRARVIVMLGAVAVAVMLASPAAAAVDSDVELAVKIDGRDLESVTPSQPLILEPSKPITVELEAKNTSNEAIEAPTVRLEGKVIGVTFIAYETEIGISLGAGETESRI